MRTRDRRSRTVVALAALAVVVMIAAVVLVVGARSRDDVVGHVDGHPITREEVAFHMSASLRSVQNRIQVAQGSAANWDWEREIDGTPARHRLQDAALDQLVRDKHVFILAEELGLVEATDHQAFLDALEAENEARSRAVARNEIVYGTVRFAPQQYYASLLTELETEVARELSRQPGDELYVSADEIEAYYEADPEVWRVNVAQYDVQRIRVPGASDPQERAELAAALDGELSAAGSLADVAAEFPGAEITDERIDGSAQVSLRGPDRDVLTQLSELEIGQRTSAIEREGWLIAYELSGREVSADEALDAYAGRIREAILAERFEALLSARIRTSEVDVDHRIVRSIEMEELEQ